MFYGRQTPHLLFEPQNKVTDSMNFEQQLYTDTFLVNVYICKNAYNVYAANSLELDSYKYIGFTNDNGIYKGCRLDYDYLVEEVQPHKNGYILFLSTLGESVWEEENV